jgi:very-short-patch-repair endonuclease
MERNEVSSVFRFGKGVIMPVEKLITQQVIDPVVLEMARENRRGMTPMEAKLWMKLRKNQLGGFHFRRQQVIGKYIVDFFCNPARLIVEVDGEVHLNQREYDRERELELMARGLKVIRFSNNKIENNLDMVLNKILEACKNSFSSISEEK